MDERNQNVSDTVRRMLSERIRLSLPDAASRNRSDWNFGSKLIEQRQVSAIAPLSTLQLRWRLVESDVLETHNANAWCYSGHAYWDDRKIVYKGKYIRHAPSGAFLSFILELIVGDNH